MTTVNIQKCLNDIDDSIDEVVNELETISEFCEFTELHDDLKKIHEDLSEIHKDLQCQNVLKAMELCEDWHIESNNFTALFIKAWEDLLRIPIVNHK